MKLNHIVFILLLFGAFLTFSDETNPFFSEEKDVIAQADKNSYFPFQIAQKQEHSTSKGFDLFVVAVEKENESPLSGNIKYSSSFFRENDIAFIKENYKTKNSYIFYSSLSPPV